MSFEPVWIARGHHTEVPAFAFCLARSAPDPNAYPCGPTGQQPHWAVPGQPHVLATRCSLRASLSGLNQGGGPGFSSPYQEIFPPTAQLPDPPPSPPPPPPPTPAVSHRETGRAKALLLRLVRDVFTELHPFKFKRFPPVPLFCCTHCCCLFATIWLMAARNKKSEEKARK